MAEERTATMKPDLTPDEQEALALSGKLAQAMRKVIGDGPQAVHDWREVATSIHDIQSRILSQPAARLGLCRPLGGRPEIPCSKISSHEEHPWDGGAWHDGRAIEGLWFCPGVRARLMEVDVTALGPAAHKLVVAGLVDRSRT